MPEDRYKFLQFRPRALRESVLAREQPPDLQWGRVAYRDLSRYYWLIDEMNRLREELTTDDKAAVARAIPAPPPLQGTRSAEPDLSFLYGLPAMVERAGGSSRLRRLMDAMSVAELLALVDLVERERVAVPA